MSEVFAGLVATLPLRFMITFFYHLEKKLDTAAQP